MLVVTGGGLVALALLLYSWSSSTNFVTLYSGLDASDSGRIVDQLRSRDIPFSIGMPAQQLDFLAYQRFILAVVADERFNADTLLSAIRAVNTQFSLAERLAYARVAIPRMKVTALELEANFEFLEGRPLWGPGRVDTFSPYEVRFHLDPQPEDPVGTVDFPSLWNQGVREGMSLHWDGNNDSLAERNISAALGAAVSEDALDVDSVEHVEDWILKLQPPAFPAEEIARSLVYAGGQIFADGCASCHALDGDRVGGVTEILVLGTDPNRLDSFTPELTEHMNTLGAGREWVFSHFGKTDGYANMPLDGIWLRAPYLHNGSVPTLRDLLEPPADRPVAFCRGSDVYDFERLGFVSGTSEADCLDFWFDTRERGNGVTSRKVVSQCTILINC